MFYHITKIESEVEMRVTEYFLTNFQSFDIVSLVRAKSARVRENTFHMHVLRRTIYLTFINCTFTIKSEVAVSIGGSQDPKG